jgi:beta-N-acetylhexosaminidase
LRDLSDIEPIITIDQEGGRVSRLRLIGNEPPSAQQLRDKNDIDLIRRHGDITGRLLRLFGFNLDLCPVLDISFDDDAENSLRGRCYGKDVQQVVRNAGAFNETMCLNLHEVDPALARLKRALCAIRFPLLGCSVKSTSIFSKPRPFRI